MSDSFSTRQYLYKGTVLKSYFECCVAYMLDLCGQPWEYEPYVHDRNRGTAYKPDFWVPHLRLWIEPRGYFNARADEQILTFAARIEQGITVFQNEIGSVRDRGVCLNDPSAPGWQYHDYLVMYGHEEKPIDMRFHYCGRRRPSASSSSHVPQRLVRRECRVCNRWFIVPIAFSEECTSCGTRRSQLLGEREYILGFSRRRLVFRSNQGEVKYLDAPCERV